MCVGVDAPARTACMARAAAPAVPTRASAREPILLRWGRVTGPIGSAWPASAGRGSMVSSVWSWAVMVLPLSDRCRGRAVVGALPAGDRFLQQHGRDLPVETEPEHAVADPRQPGQETGGGNGSRRTAVRPVLLYCGERQPGAA